MKQVQEYWPPILKEVKEFEEISKTENPELEMVWKEINNLINDQFIEIATEKGIARREKILKIVPFADDDLESRRFRVKARWNDELPYTYRVLINKLNQLCGNDGYLITLNAGEYTLDIKIELTQKRMFDEVDKVVRNIVPANLLLKVGLRYNQHNRIAKLTHEQLKAYTHYLIRNEVLN